MRGLGYNIETGIAGRRRSWRTCPTLSHVSAAGGTAQMCADWAFVSPVSLVSPNLKLIKDYRKGRVEKARKDISRRYAPYAGTTGTSAKNTSLYGETTRAGQR